MSVSAEIQAFPAPAKLNLDLRITGRRSDGYHNLESIFCLIGLYDTVHLKMRTDGQIILHTPVEGLKPEQDLTYRAAKLLLPYASVPYGVEIWLDKVIPTGGGLGGGSSDAATVLMVLNQWWQCGLSRQQLIDLGVSHGADVPFLFLAEVLLPKVWARSWLK